MILKRLFTLSALALAVSLGLSDRAHAAFTLTTTTTNITVDGAPVATITPVAAGSTITLNSSPTTSITATNGGVSFSDGVSTIYLLNDSQTVNTVGVTNEQVFESTPTGASDMHTFNFTTLILVNGTQAFTETLTTPGYTNAIGGGQFTILGPGVGGASITPTSVPIAGVTYTSSQPNATDGNANSSQNPDVTARIVASAVPEPASVVMLGSGLVGVIGLGLRRRIKKA